MFRWRDKLDEGPVRVINGRYHQYYLSGRFLIHVLPRGFHRIRHYGLLANHVRVKQVQRLRQLLSDENIDNPVEDPTPETDTADDHPTTSTYTCRTCGAPMIIIETFEKQMPRAPPLLS